MSYVRNKRHFVELYKRGVFGNAGPTWDSTDSWSAWYKREVNSVRPETRYHLRNREPGGPTIYNVEPDRLLQMSRLGGYREPYWYVSEMAPHEEHGTIQGEAMRTSNGLEFRWTDGNIPMRDALLKGSNVVYGVRAIGKLKRYMNHLSYDWLMELLDEYENHIVEFSCFDICWGTLPGYNTVFWEIRPDRAIGSNLSKFTEVY